LFVKIGAKDRDFEIPFKNQLRTHFTRLLPSLLRAHEAIDYQMRSQKVPEIKGKNGQVDGLGQ
tara:strand:+ start:574 stop:762 length:189 start_codon:yes stop_codon:yes gene_type:complete